MRFTCRAFTAAASAMLVVCWGMAPAMAQDKPAELKIGITTFLSGPASVFGVPGNSPSTVRASGSS